MSPIADEVHRSTLALILLLAGFHQANSHTKLLRSLALRVDVTQLFLCNSPSQVIHKKKKPFLGKLCSFYPPASSHFLLAHRKIVRLCDIIMLPLVYSFTVFLKRD